MEPLPTLKELHYILVCRVAEDQNEEVVYQVLTNLLASSGVNMQLIPTIIESPATELSKH